MKLDTTDLRILEAIQRDGRITKLALAEQVGLSATPCWTRLRRLERAGVITGYHARIAPRMIASAATVMMEVTLGAHRQSDFDRFEQTVQQIPEITACWALGGGVDYLLKFMTRDIDAYQRLVDSLLQQEIGIARYFTYIVTRPVKEEIALPIAKLLPDSSRLNPPRPTDRNLRFRGQLQTHSPRG